MILILVAVVTLVFGAIWLWKRKRVGALFYITAAGVIYGFVATLAKVVITRIQTGDFEGLTFICLASLLGVAAVGAYFVQTAYSSGPPDLVIAGLTVIDPIVAILIGLIILNEAAGAPLWVYIAFGIVGAVAVWGVFQLARYHPQIVNDSKEHAIQRGSTGGTEVAHPITGSIRVTEAVSKVWPDPPVKDKGDGSTPDAEGQPR